MNQTAVSRVDTTSRTIMWTIRGISQLSTELDKAVLSPGFSVGSFRFSVQLYWGGSKEEKKGSAESKDAPEPSKSDYVGLFVDPDEEDEQAAECEFTWMAGGQVVTQPHLLDDTTFRGAAWGFPNCWRRDELLVHAAKNHNELSVRIKVQLSTFNATAPDHMPAASVPSLLRDMESLLGAASRWAVIVCSLRFADKCTCLCSDVKLVVGGTEFSAHRLILSLRSPVFAAMLSSKMSESQGEVEIEDCDPRVFQQFLRYVRVLATRAHRC